jgi:hypothetical protein
MASIRKRGRHWYYRYVDADGVKQERKGCPDKRVTEELARAAESESARIKAGVIDPRALGLRDHDARPLTTHIKDWHAYLLAKGATRDHAELSQARVTRLIELARIGRISELTPSKAQAALKAIHDAGAALRTVCHYTTQIKGFSRWLWRDGRARENSLDRFSLSCSGVPTVPHVIEALLR